MGIRFDWLRFEFRNSKSHSPSIGNPILSPPKPSENTGIYVPIVIGVSDHPTALDQDAKKGGIAGIMQKAKDFAKGAIGKPQESGDGWATLDPSKSALDTNPQARPSDQPYQYQITAHDARPKTKGKNLILWTGVVLVIVAVVIVAAKTIKK